MYFLYRGGAVLMFTAMTMGSYTANIEGIKVLVEKCMAAPQDQRQSIPAVPGPARSALAMLMPPAPE